jgi:hypothetical protein
MLKSTQLKIGSFEIAVLSENMLENKGQNGKRD